MGLVSGGKGNSALPSMSWDSVVRDGARVTDPPADADESEVIDDATSEHPLTRPVTAPPAVPADQAAPITLGPLSPGPEVVATPIRLDVPALDDADSRTSDDSKGLEIPSLADAQAAVAAAAKRQAEADREAAEALRREQQRAEFAEERRREEEAARRADAERLAAAAAALHTPVPDAPSADAATPTPPASPVPAEPVVVAEPAPAPEPVAAPEPAASPAAAQPTAPVVEPTLAAVGSRVADGALEAPVVDVAPDRKARRAAARAAKQHAQEAQAAAKIAQSRNTRSDRVARRPDRSRGMAGTGFVLLLVAGVAAGGVVFGRSFLDASPWQSDVLPFAESIESVRGVDFVEPITVTEQPGLDHRTMVNASLFADVEAQLPMWRALGLSGPEGTDAATLNSLVEDVYPTFYSPADGQVYVDESYVLGDLSARTMQAMAAAALDQSFTFSPELATMDPDTRAFTDAHVFQQVELIQRASTEPFAVVDPNVSRFAFLPPVLDYRLSAPIAFADLLPAFDPAAPNPLAQSAQAQPWPALHEPLRLLARTSQTDGDQPVAEATTMDRGFWYMVFASHLDPVTAYEMSISIEEAGLQTVIGAEGTCAVATLSGGNSDVNAVLTASLTRWAGATAPEMNTTVSALPDSSVQLRSCDPAVSYTSNARFGVSRQLLGWRAAELALATSLLEQGATPADVVAVMPIYAATPGVLRVVELPAGTPVADVVSAAQVAVVEFGQIFQGNAEDTPVVEE